MAGVFKSLKAGFKAAMKSTGQGEFAAAGIQVVCPHCHNKEFELGEALLNTAGMAFLELDWLNKRATVLVCTHCSWIQWFGTAPERLKQ